MFATLMMSSFVRFVIFVVMVVVFVIFLEVAVIPEFLLVAMLFFVVNILEALHVKMKYQ